MTKIGTYVSGDRYFWCVYRSKNLSCKNDGITALKRHDIAKKHVKNIPTPVQTSAHSSTSQEKSNSNPIHDMCRARMYVKDRARTIELQLAMFIVHKNLHFQSETT